MTYNLYISEESNMINISPKGNYTFNEIKELINVVVNDPHYKPTFNILADLRYIKYIPVISEIFELSRFTVSMKQYFKGKTAIIVNTEVLYSLFKLSAMFSSKEGIQSEIFYNTEDAMTWITDSTLSK